MNLCLSYYIGHQDYLDVNPEIDEEESSYQLVQEISPILYRNIGYEETEIYTPKDKNIIQSTLDFSGNEISAFGFNSEAVLANDQAGCPFLFYVNAYFKIPEELEDEILELESNGRLDFEIVSKLKIDGHEFEFNGVAELMDEE